MSNSSIDGSVALISGGVGGIGLATARLFVESGASVILGDIAPDAQRLASDLGAKALAVALDVTDEASWRAAVDAGAAHFGSVDVLVNAAGVFDVAAMEHTTTAAFDRLYRVNQLGCLLGMQAVVASMRSAGGGSIVNVSSAAGLGGAAGYAAYGATKWAVRGLTRSAAIEFGPFGVRVNAVLPGSIDTPMVQTPMTTERRDFFAALPVPRQGLPDDVARAARFFASNESEYCTGAELVVDGGLTAEPGLPPRT